MFDSFFLAMMHKIKTNKKKKEPGHRVYYIFFTLFIPIYFTTFRLSHDDLRSYSPPYLPASGCIVKTSQKVGNDNLGSPIKIFPHLEKTK